MKYSIYILFFFIINSISIFSTTYYVDKDNKFGNGSHNNWPGTLQQPKYNLQHGWFQENLMPGDTVIIRGAASYGELRFGGSSGTLENPIVIMVWPGDTIISNSDIVPAQFAIRLLDGASHIEINGPMYIKGREFSFVALGNNAGIKFTDAEIDDCQHGPRLNGTTNSEFKNLNIHDLTINGFQLRGSLSASTGDPCKNLLIENVVAFNINDNRTPENSDADGFHSFGGENIKFINCSTWNNAEDGFDLNCNALMVNCMSYDNSGSGIKVWRREGDNFAEKTLTAINCIVTDNGYHSADTNPGIKVSYGAGLNFYNGVVVGGYDQGINVRFVESDGTFINGLEYQKVRVYNSIITNTTSGTGINSMNHPTQGNLLEANYNLFFNNFSDFQGFIIGKKSITGFDPLFVDEDDHDFSLKNGSPAINKGTYQLDDSLYSIYGEKDFNGVSRFSDSLVNIGAFENDIITSDLRSTVLVPENYKLSNYPNPFNPNTKIQFNLPEASDIKLEIYDITGEKIVTLIEQYLIEGEYEEIWNGKNSNNKKVKSGVYFYILKANSNILIRKMILIK